MRITQPTSTSALSALPLSTGSVPTQKGSVEGNNMYEVKNNEGRDAVCQTHLRLDINDSEWIMNTDIGTN